jgi:hypothetical protein
MALIDYVLGQQSLQQLGPDVQDQARSEGYRRFILGTLLGGKGLASGYAAAQEVIPGIQAAEQQRRVNQAVENSMVNLGVRPGSQLAMLQGQMDEANPDLALPDASRLTSSALQRNVQQKNAAPGMGGTGLSGSQQMLQRFDPTLFSRNIAPVMAGQDPVKALQAAQMGAPKTLESTGLQLDPFSQNVVGSIPTEKDFVQRQFDIPSGQFVANPVAGARSAQEAVRPTAVNTGQQINQGVVQTAPGFLTSQADITANQTTAEQAARAPFELVTVTDPSGRTYQISKSALLGGQGQAAQPGQPAAGPQLFSGLGPMDTSAMKQYDEDRLQIAGQANSARQRQVSYDRIKQIYNNPAFDPTKLSPVRAELTGVLRGFGLTGEAADQFISQYRTAEQAINRLTLDTLPELSGAISNFEIGYIGTTQPRITDPKKSVMFNIAVMEAAGDKLKAQQDFMLKNRAPDARLQWERSPEGQKSIFESPKLLQYIKEYSAPEQRRTVTAGPNKGKTAYQMPDGRFRVIN